MVKNIFLVLAAVGLVIVSVLGTKLVLERQTTKPAPPVQTPAETPVKTTPETPAASPAAVETITDPNVATFTSTNLGISFRYLKSQGGQTFNTLESGNKVYVYFSTVKPETGQSVEVFSKDPAQPLDSAVKQRFLSTGYLESDCLVKPASEKLPVGYVGAEIQVPRTDNDDMESLSLKWAKCPAKYTTQNGISYFLMDPAHPAKFVYLSIGQYLIPAPGTEGWQATLKLL